MKSCRKAASIGLLPNSYSVIDIYICFVAAVSLVGLVCSVGAYGSDSECYNFTDFSVYGWGSQGVSSWYRDDSTGHNSSTSLRSGLIECNGFSGVYRYVPAPAEIQFWWKSDTTIERGGKLIFVVDGEERLVCSADGWEKEVYPMYSGGEIGWEFRKIKCYPQDKGSGWIDDICITYAAPRNESVVGPGVGWPQYNGTIPQLNFTLTPANITIIASEIKILPTKVEMGPITNVTVDSVSDIRVNNSNFTGVPNCLGVGSYDGGFRNISIDSVVKVILVEPDDPPVVELVGPQDNFSSFVDTDIDFIYQPNDDKSLASCALFVNDVNVMKNETPLAKCKNNTLTTSFGMNGTYRWHIRCCDNSSQCINSSEIRHIVIGSLPDIVYVNESSDPDNHTYDSIGEAVEHVARNGTIYIVKRTCDEMVVMSKPVSLIGVDNPLICNSNIDERGGIIIIKSSYVNITNLSIKGYTNGPHGSKKSKSSGIKSLDGNCYTNISISNISIDGGPCYVGSSIDLINCRNVSVISCKISMFVDCGICLANCNVCHLYNNTMNTNYIHKCCTSLENCSNFKISNNSMFGSYCRIGT